MHSKEVADKITSLNDAMSKTSGYGDRIVDAIESMGPGCLYDDPENEEQAKGMLIVLDWILKTVLAS